MNSGGGKQSVHTSCRPGTKGSKRAVVHPPSSLFNLSLRRSSPQELWGGWAPDTDGEVALCCVKGWVLEAMRVDSSDPPSRDNLPCGVY